MDPDLSYLKIQSFRHSPISKIEINIFFFLAGAILYWRLFFNDHIVINSLIYLIFMEKQFIFNLKVLHISSSFQAFWGICKLL